MSFRNIFDSGGNEAKSAEESARKVSEDIPGARPEREGVDPELYDGIPEAARDPKIVRETSPEALNIMNNFITPVQEHPDSSRQAAGIQRRPRIDVRDGVGGQGRGIQKGGCGDQGR